MTSQKEKIISILCHIALVAAILLSLLVPDRPRDIDDIHPAIQAWLEKPDSAGIPGKDVDIIILPGDRLMTRYSLSDCCHTPQEYMECISKEPTFMQVSGFLARHLYMAGYNTDRLTKESLRQTAGSEDSTLFEYFRRHNDVIIFLDIDDRSAPQTDKDFYGAIYRITMLDALSCDTIDLVTGATPRGDPSVTAITDDIAEQFPSLSRAIVRNIHVQSHH